MKFKRFLLKENTDHLHEKIGDLLNAVDSLHEDAPNLGNRQIIRSITGIVGQIRQILHDSWLDENRATLRELQKIGVALMKSIDSNEDLREAIGTASQILHTILRKSKKPINDIGSNEID